jgi:hypothetical protein
VRRGGGRFAGERELELKAIFSRKSVEEKEMEMEREYLFCGRNQLFAPVDNPIDIKYNSVCTLKQ